MAENGAPRAVSRRTADGGDGTPMPPCGRRFPEEMLSGYLDGALTQGDEQRVRLHLEDCPACRGELAELAELREAARTTRFVTPADEAWDERPHGAASRLLHGGGWVLLVAWLVAIAGYALWQVAVDTRPTLEKLALFAGLAGGVMLLASVALDRLRELPGDRYRRLKR